MLNVYNAVDLSCQTCPTKLDG